MCIVGNHLIEFMICEADVKAGSCESNEKNELNGLEEIEFFNDYVPFTFKILLCCL